MKALFPRVVMNEKCVMKKEGGHDFLMIHACMHSFFVFFCNSQQRAQRFFGGGFERKN